MLAYIKGIEMKCYFLDNTIELCMCPLARGRCYYQHVKTNVCKYSDDIAVHFEHPSKSTVDHFMRVTGRNKLPTNTEMSEFKEKLLSSIKNPAT